MQDFENTSQATLQQKLEILRRVVYKLLQSLSDNNYLLNRNLQGQKNY